MANCSAHSVVYLLITISHLSDYLVICSNNTSNQVINSITTQQQFHVQDILDDATHNRNTGVGGGQLASAPYQLDSHANFVSPDGQLIASVPASMLQEMSIDVNTKDDSIASKTFDGNVRQTAEGFNLREMLDQFSSSGTRQNVSFSASSSSGSFANGNNNNAMVIDGETVLSTLANNHRLKPQPIRNKAAAVINLMPMVPTRSSIVEVAAENFTMRKISEQANIFATRLLSQVDQEQLYAGNVILAPFAVYQGLALLLSGAQGETAQQLDQLLLGSESTYTELAKQSSSLNQDRPRLMVSLNEIIKNLRQNSTQNSNYALSVQQNTNSHLLKPLITANHLLFSPATEISNEFKHIVENYYDEVPLTKMEVGSFESVLNVNNWIRSATSGIIPNILNRKTTFDEFNVMTLLSTAWMQQEWLDNFQRVTSQTKQFVRLKSGRGVIATQQQQQSFVAAQQQPAPKAPILMEFVDDNRQSHFVEYIVSQPSKNIKKFKMEVASTLKVDVVEVPFKYSDYKMVVLMPQQLNNIPPVVSNTESGPSAPINPTASTASTSTSTNNNANGGLTKLIQLLANNPKDSLRDIFNLIDPDMITKSIYDNQQSSRRSNFSSSSMIIKDDLEDDDTIDTINTNYRVPNGIKLSMPLLKTEADLTLSATLNKLGITSALDPYQANFIGINGHPFNYYKLHLTKVLFKTNLNVDERGINYDKTIQTLDALRLAAQMDRNRIASSLEPVSGVNQADIEEFSLNRPFMYFIRDYKTKLIVFVGTVRDPSLGM